MHVKIVWSVTNPCDEQAQTERHLEKSNLMERNGSAVILCAVSSGSSLSFLWMNGSSEVKASDRVQLTDGGSTLTIVNVTRYDQGPFRCHVVNPVSNGTSSPVNFSINGPDNMALTVNGQNMTSFSAGSNVTMICLAESSPPAQFLWAVRGELVSTTGPLLEVFSVSEDQSGLYSCVLKMSGKQSSKFNKTNKFSNCHAKLSLLFLFIMCIPYSKSTVVIIKTR
uniref:Ig-like domain-containing protein n=1 Tax=Mola mola TaxID=94237 RepID=A0A3Q3WXX1_MOLML